ncbi:MAG: S8 family serine peptidase [Planctomycetes bacterium]|nr:S8 family serine peptidase [Planctomycetota bacterium]
MARNAGCASCCLVALAIAGLTGGEFAFAGGTGGGVVSTSDVVYRAPDAGGSYATTHILVRLAPGIMPLEGASGQTTIDNGPIDALCDSWGVLHVEPFLAVRARNQMLADQLGLSRTYRLHVPTGTDTAAMADGFTGVPGIELAELDGVGGIALTIPNDPAFGSLWNMHNTGQTSGTVDADVDGPEAWDIYTGSADLTLAIIDTGVQADHPDLNGKVIAGRNTYDDNFDTDDPHGHGTHCTGIAAAYGNNGIGVTGINWEVTILAMRCTSPTGSATESDCAEAIIWAVDNGADIGSLSLQFYTGTTTLEEAVNYAYGENVLLIAATGNNYGNIVAYPAKFAHCMGVAATTHNDTWYTSSNYGPETDVSAPGKDVYSLWKNSGYYTNSGTSMATPHVSGLAALMMSYNFALSIDQIEQMLKDSAEDKGDPGWDEQFGWGRINAEFALLAADPRGDLNCDGVVDGFDIDPFILALNGQEGYLLAYPGCDFERGDTNSDGAVNGFDIDSFIVLLNQ